MLIDRLVVMIALVLLGALLFVLERFVWLRRSRRPLLPRLIVNAAISMLAFAIAMLFVRPIALGVLRWAADAPFGAVRALQLPVPTPSIVSFLLMDLTFLLASA